MRDRTRWPKALVFRPEHYVWPVTTIFKKSSKDLSVNESKTRFNTYGIRTLFLKIKMKIRFLGVIRQI